MKLISAEITRTVDGDKFTLQASEPVAPILDLLIAHLGQMRANMQPPVNEADPASGTTQFVWDNARCVVGQQLDGQVTLAIRHPGFGWVNFRYPLGAIAQIQQHLSRAIESPVGGGTSH